MRRLKHQAEGERDGNMGDRSPELARPDARAIVQALPAYPMLASAGQLADDEVPEYQRALLAFADAFAEQFPAEECQAIKFWARTLYPHQLDLVFDPWRFSILNKSRKIGASYAYAGWAVLRAMLGEETIIVSESQEVADEVVSDAKLHANALVQAGSQWAEDESSNTSELVFASGGRIIARPSTNAGRSFSGNVILDEFAYHNQPKKVWDAAVAVAALGYSVRVLSTPNGVGNLFHALVTNEQMHRGWRVLQMSLAYARTGGMSQIDDESCWRMARNDPTVYDQLFGCVFLDADMQYLPHELVAAASTATLDELAMVRGDGFAGCDIAKVRDLFVVAPIVVDDDGIVWVLPQQACKRIAYREMRSLVAQGFEEHAWRRLAVDATGIGNETAERMQQRHGRMRVELVWFTAQVKEDLATRLYEWLQEGRIRILRDASDIRRDLYALRRIITKAGNVRYDAARTDDGHADRAWALALALLAAARNGIGKENRTRKTNIFAELEAHERSIVVESKLQLQSEGWRNLADEYDDDED